MRINQVYLNRFKLYKYGYMYMIKRGLFLLFDKDTLEYIGLFYIYTTKEMDKEAEEVINKLIALDYLEV